MTVPLPARPGGARVCRRFTGLAPTLTLTLAVGAASGLATGFWLSPLVASRATRARLLTAELCLAIALIGVLAAGGAARLGVLGLLGCIVTAAAAPLLVGISLICIIMFAFLVTALIMLGFSLFDSSSGGDYEMAEMCFAAGVAVVQFVVAVYAAMLEALVALFTTGRATRRIAEPGGVSGNLGGACFGALAAAGACVATSTALGMGTATGLALACTDAGAAACWLTVSTSTAWIRF
jgi:hypothetical protein